MTDSRYKSGVEIGFRAMITQPQQNGALIHRLWSGKGNEEDLGDAIWNLKETIIPFPNVSYFPPRVCVCTTAKNEALTPSPCVIASAQEPLPPAYEPPRRCLLPPPCLPSAP